jgi:hypothetical protein
MIPAFDRARLAHMGNALIAEVHGVRLVRFRAIMQT